MSEILKTNPRGAGAKPKPAEKKHRQRSISLPPEIDDYLKTLPSPSAYIVNLIRQELINK